MVYGQVIKEKRKKNKIHHTARILIVLLVIGLILISGPASGVTINGNNINSSYTVGDTISPTITSTFSGTTSSRDDLAADANVQWQLINATNTVVSSGSKAVSSFSDTNYGQNDSNTYGFWRQGYGYGYGTGSLSWSPSISTSGLSNGSYTLRLSIVNSSGTVASTDKSLTLDSGGGGTVSLGVSGGAAGSSRKKETEEAISPPEPVTETPSTEEVSDSCKTMVCNDRNPCTLDSCADGVCQYAKVEDGTSCLNGKCFNGVCQKPPEVATAVTAVTEEKTEEIDWAAITGGVIVGLVALLLVVLRAIGLFEGGGLSGISIWGKTKR